MNTLSCARFGGRVALMCRLLEIGEAAGIPVARFDGIDYEIVNQLHTRSIEASRETADSPLIDDATVEATLASLVTSVSNDLGLPVMKLSYLDNRNPKELSFAGVGATSVPRNATTSLSRCFFATLHGLGKPYAEYYRKQHPQFASNKTGLMIMEHLPTKDVWGTAWSCGRNLILEIQSKKVGTFHTRVTSSEGMQRIASHAPATIPILKSIERIRSLTAALPPLRC